MVLAWGKHVCLVQKLCNAKMQSSKMPDAAFVRPSSNRV